MNSIATAICSFGMSGQLFHAPFIAAHPEFNLYGILERTKSMAQETYPGIRTFRNLQEVLDDPVVELVILNTPNVTHYPMAKEILLSGKHLVVEKPFTTTVAEAEELIALATKKQLILSVFQNRRWDSDFQTVQSILAEGKLGTIVDAELRYDRFEPKLSQKSHKETPVPGVGSLYDLGPHLIDQALLLFGRPTAVYAYLDAFREHSKVDDYFDLTLYYPSHIVRLKSSYFVCNPLPAYVVNGKKGSFLKRRSDIQEAMLKEGKTPTTTNWGTEPASEYGILHYMEDGQLHQQTIPSKRGNYMAYYDGIFNAIRHQVPVPVSAEEGKQVIQIIEAAIKSNATKNRVYL